MAWRYRVRGNLDASYVQGKRIEIEGLAKKGQNVVMDLSLSELIDSTGIGILIFLHKRLAIADRRLLVVGLKGQPLKLFSNLQLIPVLCQ